MVLDNYFMALPVYRINKETYFLNMDDYIQKEMYSTERDVDFYKNNQPLKEQYEGYLRCAYGGPWEFNEIIGFIKIYFYGTQVRGEYWAVNTQRIVKTRKKQFEYKTHKLYMEIGIKERTNEGILKAVRDYIEGCKSEIPRRHIDTREFETLASHINWATLYASNNRFT